MKQIITSIPVTLFCFLLLVCEGCTNSHSSQPEKTADNELYQCLPCGAACDKQTYNQTGKCPDCHMELVKRSSITFKSIEPTTICDYIKKHPAAVLLDVRTKEEFEGRADPDFGTLKNAINIPVQELESRLASISDLKNKEVLVFCSHSHRSPRASYLLTQSGFTNVTNMDGGMSEVRDTACKK
jgi:rhodanese-related sulfurtransferase/DNA-directed RNA polymerase subunit RPC12/RpoP